MPQTKTTPFSKCNKRTDIKPELEIIRLLYMHPLIVMILFDISAWHLERGLPFIVTDILTTIEQDAALKRVSTTHRDGRAFDFRIKNLEPWQLAEMQGNFNTKYKELAAVDKQGYPKLIVVHGTGANRHAHVQIHRRYAQDYSVSSAETPPLIASKQ